MNVPGTFVPKKKYTFEELKRKKRGRKKEVKNKIGKIEDLVLDPEDLGAEYIIAMERITEDSLECNKSYIQWSDLSDSIRIIYEGRVLAVNIFEFHTESKLNLRISDIYEEGHSDDLLYERRAFIVGKYALILYGTHRTKESVDRMEKVYRKRFGAERLVQREWLELE